MKSNKSTRLFYRVFLISLTAMYMITPAKASLTYSVSFNDPSQTFSSYYNAINSHVIASGAAWDRYIVGDASLEVQINFSSSVRTANGASTTSSFVRNTDGVNIFEQGAAGEINTGVDPNGLTPDIKFTIGSNYLIDELWFDPDPFSRTATIASNRTDAFSVFLHEFGHAFAFNGWRDPFNGSLPGNFQSTFDENVFFDGNDLFFQGERARNVFGGDVPLTFGNSTHLGNDLPRPGSELIPDLMNGVVSLRETRYDISELDLAILADSGITVVPIPSAIWLFSSGLTGIMILKRRRKLTC